MVFETLDYRNGGGNMFTLNPEIVLKSRSSLKILGVHIRGEVMKSSRSSANKVHLWTRGPHLTPLMSGWSLMVVAKVSIAMAKIMGDRGQPCLVPLCIEKVFE